MWEGPVEPDLISEPVEEPAKYPGPLVVFPVPPEGIV